MGRFASQQNTDIIEDGLHLLLIEITESKLLN
jgi:hypothetical protein